MRKFYLTNIIISFNILTFVITPSFAANNRVTKLGDIMQVGLPTAAASLTLINKDEEGFKQFLKSFMAANGAMHAIKFAAGKTPLGKRPNGKTGSFPSGHTTAAFQGAFFLQQRYGSKFGISAIGLASFVGYSRVQAKCHHPRDVIAGIGIAALATYQFVTKFDPETTKITANYSPNNVSMQIKLKL